jgi:hypothetical protein
MSKKTKEETAEEEEKEEEEEDENDDDENKDDEKGDNVVNRPPVVPIKQKIGPFIFISRVQIKPEMDKLKKDVCDLTTLDLDKAQVLLINFNYSYDKFQDAFLEGLFFCVFKYLKR